MQRLFDLIHAANSDSSLLNGIDDIGDPTNCEIRPERNLLAALMARAICDAFAPTFCEAHHTRSALRWLFSPLTPKRPFSFAWVSLLLDLDPKSLQRYLKTTPESELVKKISILHS